MYKFIITFLALVLFSNTYGQKVQIIESDVLENSNYFSNFTDDGKGNYYAVSRARGVFKFDLDGNVEKYPVDCINTNCLDVAVDNNGKLFFASSSGITTIDENGEMVVLYQDFLKEISLGQNGEIYFIGDSVGKNLFGVYKDGEVEGYDEDNSIIIDPNFHAIESDGLGNVWFAGQDGLYRYQDGDFELISSEQIFDLHIDNDNRIYVAQGSELLALLDPTDNYNYKTFDTGDAKGRFFVGQPEVHKLAIDDFGNMRYKRSAEWKRIDLSDQGLSKAIPRAVYIDKSGNIIYSKDFDNNIYVITPGEEDYEEGEKGFEDLTEIKVIEGPWQFIIAYSKGAEISKIELFIDEDTRVYREFIDSQIASINTSDLPSGTYLVKLSSIDGTKTKEVVIE